MGRLEELIQRTMRRSRNCAEGRIYDGGLKLKLARTRTEVLSVGQRLQDGTRVKTVDTRAGNAVTAPVDFNALFLEVYNDRSGDSEGGDEGSGGDAGSLSA
jgi:hypothetical protein